MENSERNSRKPWAVVLAVLAVAAVAFLVLYRVESRLRALCKRVEASLRLNANPMTIELENDK